MKFWKNLFKASGESVEQSAIQAIANKAPDLMSKAGILEAEERLDEATSEFAKARAEYTKEQKEADEAKALYDQRMTAAENINAQLEAADDAAKPALEASLVKLLETIEKHGPEVDREVQEAVLAKDYMDQCEQLMNELADDLKNAKANIEEAQRNQAAAEKQEQLAKRMEERAKKMAGLQSGSSSFNTAIDAMNKNADAAKQRADAATLKANLLKTSKVEEEDDTIAQAMAAASGSPAAGGSLTDRLAALKK